MRQEKKRFIKMLNSDSGYTVPELVEKLEIKKSTIYEWIDDLRINGASLPESCKGKTTRYRFLEPYNIEDNEVALNLTRPLQVCLDFLDSYKNNPYFADVRHALKSKINKVSKSDITLEKKERIVFFETPPLRKGVAHFQKILNAIKKYYTLSFTYDIAYTQKLKTVSLQPYALREHNGMWYVFGLDIEKERFSSLPLDRIENVKIISRSPFEKKQIDLKTYFNDIFGIVKTDAPVTEIILQFKHNTGDWILSRPIHPSQTEISRDDDHVTVSIKVRWQEGNFIASRELYREICKWGADVNVIEPKEMVGEISYLLKNASKQYR